MTDDIPIYVINLDRSSGRLDHARRELESQQLTFTRIPAIDASDLDGKTLADVFDADISRRSYYAPMHRGEIACFLSHRLAWETFLATSRAPFAVIFEDDFALRGALAPAISAIKRMPALDWDMIKLWSGRGSIVSSMPLDETRRLVRHRVVPLRAIGQLVTRGGAEKLLARTLPIRRPVDVQLQYWWELGLDVQSIDPSLVADASGATGGSEIKRTAGTGAATKLRREIGRPLFRLWLLAQSIYHNRRQRHAKYGPHV